MQLCPRARHQAISLTRLLSTHNICRDLNREKKRIWNSKSKPRKKNEKRQHDEIWIIETREKKWLFLEGYFDIFVAFDLSISFHSMWMFYQVKLLRPEYCVCKLNKWHNMVRNALKLNYKIDVRVLRNNNSVQLKMASKNGNRSKRYNISYLKNIRFTPNKKKHPK